MTETTDEGTGTNIPQRIYDMNESCCLCGFCFIVHKIDANGENRVVKLFKLKLKLTDERIRVIQTLLDIPSQSNGVCVKCFGKVERVIKLRKFIDTIMSNFEEYLRGINGSTRSVIQRGAPLVPESSKSSEVVSNKVSKMFAQYKAILPKSQGGEDSSSILRRKSLSFSPVVHMSCTEGDTASAWKQLRGRFYWLNDGEIAEHLIEVHDQWCGDQCPLLQSRDKQKSESETSCDLQKSGSETSCDRPDVIPNTQSIEDNKDTSIFTDVIPSVQSNGENKNTFLQLEVDEGAESVDDDSSNDSYHDPASDEEDDIKQEPEFMDCTPQNGDSTYQKGDEVSPLSTNKWTDSVGDHLTQTIPVIKQEPTDNGEYENSVTQSVDTTRSKTVSYDHTQLMLSGAVLSDTNVGVVKQEPTDSGEYENSVTKSVATSKRIVSHQDKSFVSPGAPASLSVMSSNIVTSSGAPALHSVMSTNTIASVKPSVIQGIPSTKTTALNPLRMGPQSVLNPVVSGPQSVLNPVVLGPQSVLNRVGTGPRSVFSITPGVAVAQTPVVRTPAVIGAQTLLPVTPGIAQTINLATKGNVVPPQHLNVVRRGNSLFLERASASPSTVTPNLQSPLFTFAHPVGLNLQSDSNLPPTIPMAGNVSNVGQGGFVALQPKLVPVSGVELLSRGKQVSTSSKSPSVLGPVTIAVKQETPSTNTPTGSHSRGADDKQTDEDLKQMDEKDTQGSTDNEQTMELLGALQEEQAMDLQEEHDLPVTVGKKCTRFKRLSEKDLKEMGDQRQSKSTKKKTKWGIKIFQDWSLERYGQVVDFLTISVEDLSKQLRRFYGEVQPKADISASTQNHQETLPPGGAEYHTNTIKGIRTAINRHLSDIGRLIDIVRDKEFRQANIALEGKLKQNMRMGLSKPTQHIPTISPNDLSNISTYLMTGGSPVILRYRVWYDLAIHFVSRGLEFHQQLTTHSFIFLTDDNGLEYATFSDETKQKIRQGNLEPQKAPEDMRMYATGGDFCPVASLRCLLEHTDPLATSLFNHVSKEALKTPIPTVVWYTTKPVKHHQFSQFMAEISKNSGCSRIYKTHSLRSTAFQALNSRRICIMSWL